jgi:hypothetical protein
VFVEAHRTPKKIAHVFSAPRIELGTFRLQQILQSNVINQLHQAEECAFWTRLVTLVESMPYF